MSEFIIKPAIREGPQRILVPLTRGLSALVDESDSNLVLPFKWCADFISNSWYAVRTVNKKRIYMHRMLMGFPKCRVDHRDRNGLNNSRSNLRESTPQQNCANCKKKGFTSQYKGVHWDSVRQRWKAQIKIMYQNKMLGRFDVESDAARAYDAAALSAFGEFATLNFPKHAI